MTQCPECREMILDDSAFCDKCGKELKWCPKCKRPKRGTECPVCGSDLIPGRKYLAIIEGKEVAPQAQSQSKVQSQTTAAASVVLPTALVGNGWRLTLQEGAFGRVGGMWPELASCQYVSGSHGKIGRGSDGWILVDIGSTNGTFVNGQRLESGRGFPLKKGDRVRIATLDFTVE